jgi:effector-binding domain-containing protein
MLSTPQRVFREEQPYIAIRRTVQMNEIPAELPPLVGVVKSWLDEKAITPAGDMFFHYLAMDGTNNIVSEVGFPVPPGVSGDWQFINGRFRRGYYAHIRYTGDYRFMMNAHKALEAFIIESGYKEQQSLGTPENPYGSRSEVYLTDPDDEPDPGKWVTDIYVLLAD